MEAFQSSDCQLSNPDRHLGALNFPAHHEGPRNDLLLRHVFDSVGRAELESQDQLRKYQLEFENSESPSDAIPGTTLIRSARSG